MEDIKIILKKKKKKKQQYGYECYKNLSENEKKGLLSIEKILQNKKKRFNIIIKKYFNLENVASL